VVPASHARTVVVGIDGSESSRHALTLGEELAASLAAKLVLVHAYDPHIPFSVMTTQGINDMLGRHGDKLLDAAEDRVTLPVEVVHEVVEGRARDELVAACLRHEPALLVVGSRGLGGFKKLLLGSTSRWVTSHATCPVVIARQPALV